MLIVIILSMSNSEIFFIFLRETHIGDQDKIYTEKNNVHTTLLD